MKNLIFTFGLAIAIIGGAIAVDTIFGTDSENCKLCKTVIEKDAKGRVTQEITLTADDKAWVETSKKETEYTPSFIETISYVKKGEEWVATDREISSVRMGLVTSVSTFAKACDGSWVKTSERDLNNLSSDLDLVEDLVFDANGNLIMKATYEWTENGKSGISKEEYEYAQGETNKVTSYNWNGRSWEMATISSVVAK